MKDFRFKDVDIIFNIKKLPHYDQEYLRTMAFEATGDRSVKQSGKSFEDYYPNADNFALFNHENVMFDYMSEFIGQWTNTASHLLHGKKYYFAWTYSNRNY